MSLFDAGERALFIDRKGRRYLVTLRTGIQFHTHDGFVAHDTVIDFSLVGKKPFKSRASQLPRIPGMVRG